MAFLLGSTTPELHWIIINNITHHCSSSAFSTCKQTGAKLCHMPAALSSQLPFLLTSASFSPHPPPLNSETHIYGKHGKRLSEEMWKGEQCRVFSSPKISLFAFYTVHMLIFFTIFETPYWYQTRTCHNIPSSVSGLFPLSISLLWTFPEHLLPLPSSTLAVLALCKHSSQHHWAVFSSHAAWGWASSPSSHPI